MSSPARSSGYNRRQTRPAALAQMQQWASSRLRRRGASNPAEPGRVQPAGAVVPHATSEETTLATTFTTTSVTTLMLHARGCEGPRRWTHAGAAEPARPDRRLHAPCNPRSAGHHPGGTGCLPRSIRARGGPGSQTASRGTTPAGRGGEARLLQPVGAEVGQGASGPAPMTVATHGRPDSDGGAPVEPARRPWTPRSGPACRARSSR